MNFAMLAQRLGMPPHLSVLVLVFFTYAFLGSIMECIVLTIETRKPVYKRGFTAHLPFCIIYGAGALAGYYLLSPLQDSIMLLYIAGAIGATGFEYLVGRTQQRMFGTFWWDYSEKPFNYKGILCLESTLGWGVLALLIVRHLHGGIVQFVSHVPARVAVVLAFGLVVAYMADFGVSARLAYKEKHAHQDEMEELEQLPLLK